MNLIHTNNNDDYVDVYNFMCSMACSHTQQAKCRSSSSVSPMSVRSHSMAVSVSVCLIIGRVCSVLRVHRRVHIRAARQTKLSGLDQIEPIAIPHQRPNERRSMDEGKKKVLQSRNQLRKKKNKCSYFVDCHWCSGSADSSNLINSFI